MVRPPSYLLIYIFTSTYLLLWERKKCCESTETQPQRRHGYPRVMVLITWQCDLCKNATNLQLELTVHVHRSSGAAARVAGAASPSKLPSQYKSCPHCLSLQAKLDRRPIRTTTDRRNALQRKSHLCIPSLGTARPQSQFPHSCVCERFLYSQDRSTYCRIGRPIVGIF